MEKAMKIGQFVLRKAAARGGWGKMSKKGKKGRRGNLSDDKSEKKVIGVELELECHKLYSAITPWILALFPWFMMHLKALMKTF